MELLLAETKHLSSTRTRQMKCKRGQTRRLKTYLGRVAGDIGATARVSGTTRQSQSAARAEAHEQGQAAGLARPQVEGIGKARWPPALGVKFSAAVTNHESFVVGCGGQALLHRPQLQGCRGARRCHLPLWATPRDQARTFKRELKRCSAVEAVIGHLKTDGKMGSCYLKGVIGDTLNAMLYGAGHNIRLLLRTMAVLLRRIWPQ